MVFFRGVMLHRTNSRGSRGRRSSVVLYGADCRRSRCGRGDGIVLHRTNSRCSRCGGGNGIMLDRTHLFRFWKDIPEIIHVRKSE